MALNERYPAHDRDGESGVEPTQKDHTPTRRAIQVVGAALVLALLVSASWWAVRSGVLRPDSREPASARGDGFDRLAQSALWNAYVTEMAVYSTDRAFTDEPQKLSAINPELVFGGFGSPSDIRVETGDANTTVCLGVQSESGRRYFIRQVQVGNPSAHGADTGLSVSRGASSDDFAFRCSANYGGDPWTDLPADVGWASDPYNWAFVADSCRTDAPVVRGAAPCSPEQQAQATLLNASGVGLACRDADGNWRPTENDPGDPGRSGPCTRGSYASPATTRLVETSDGGVRCIGVQSESGTRYYIKYVGIAGGPRPGYFRKSDSLSDMTLPCSKTEIAGWSIFPSVAGW